MRIVIAEKDQTGRRLLAQLLRMEGHDVLLIEEDGDSNGIMRQHRPEVVLMNMFHASQCEETSLGRPDRREKDCISPVVLMTSMRACEKMYPFMKMGASNGADAFDRLPAKEKIGTMEHVQRICEVLARSLHSSGRNGGERSATRNSGQSLLDLQI